SKHLESRVEAKVIGPVRQITPNALTVLRMILAFLFPLFPESWWVFAIVVAGVTEFLDGYLARRWNVVSHFGRQLDPVADKIFVGMVLYTLYGHQILTPFEIFFIVARDAMVVFGGVLAWLLGLGQDFLDVSPKYSGKVATGFQFLF